METDEKEYVKLPGRGNAGGWASFFGISRARCTLWLAKDHLLQAELAYGYVETCKRFYFRDIQALVLIKTKYWQIGSVLLGTLTAGFLLLMSLVKWVPKDSNPGAVALFIVGGVVGVIFVVHLVAGPTCRCYLKTAVREEELPSLRRLRRARKIIARLQPLIETAQGTISQAEVSAQFQSILQQLNLTGSVAVGQTLPYVAIIRPYRSRMHRNLYCLLLVGALAFALNLFHPSEAVTFFELITQLALVAILVIALIKQDETDLKPALKTLTWVAAGYVTVNMLTGYIIMLATITTHPALNANTNTQWGYVRSLATLRPDETPWFFWLLVATAGVSFVLGVWGNLLLGKYWSERRETGAAPPEEPPVPPKL
jgi:MFS family permease